MSGASWRATYSERFLDRAIQRPQPEPVYAYVRTTDEEIAALPEQSRPLAMLSRSLSDACAETSAKIRASWACAIANTEDATPGCCRTVPGLYGYTGEDV